ncbi:MAG: hypothetical protein JOY66_21230 [Acetobacteraceae bacterium]|nr:hypothetical protein [Acetobacteraceae bacterium]
MSIRGSLDVITPTGATGWAYAPDEPFLTVQALLGHQVIGEAVANMHRADLAAAGIGDGDCGYAITFYERLGPLHLPFVSVKPEGGDVELPRVTIAGFGDFFQALYRQWPASGRHRSVLGGLWTDRVDAPALLRGKRETGAIGAAPAGAVDDLIQAGMMLLALPPGRLGRWEDEGGTAEGKARVAFEAALHAPDVVAALRAVLEDHPLVLSPRPCAAEARFRQPSAMADLPSPAECLLLVTPHDETVVELEVVRDSHRLPEFTAGGESRWMSRTGAEALALAEPHGMVDRYVLPPDTLAAIGPGLLHRVRAPGSGAAAALAVPARAAPLRHLLGAEREVVCDNGARIWA